MTLGEFLNISGGNDTPLLILVNDGNGNYENPCNDAHYGVVTWAEFTKKPYANKWLTYNVDNAADLRLNGVGGYVLWVSRND